MSRNKNGKSNIFVVEDFDRLECLLLLVIAVKQVLLQDINRLTFVFIFYLTSARIEALENNSVALYNGNELIFFVCKTSV